MQFTKYKSMKINMILNAIRGLMGIIFPLISFPYVSKVLGVETIGKYNFAVSVISYFILFAGLGVSTYATRECGIVREDKKKIEKLANQIFTINIISTIISYVFLVIIMIAVPKLHEYTSLLLILSIQIIFGTIGIDWIYTIYEDFLYITIRSIAFQLISIIALFLFVKTPTDINIYAIITVASTVGANILNYIHSKKYCNVRLTKDMKFKKHIKPIMILFAMNMTVTIYVSFATTLLGFMTNDYCVGIYSTASKMYNIIKTIIISILAVSVPRLISYLGKKEIENYNNTASEIFKTLITLVLPSMIGIALLNQEIILLVSDSTYLEAGTPLVILAFSLISVFGAYFWTQCILIPLKKDITVLTITAISAIVNLLLNVILIPIWKQNAAAFSTLISETIVFVACWYKARNLVTLYDIKETLFKVSIGCIGIIVSVVVTRLLIKNDIIYMFLAIFIAVILYTIIEIIMKNDVVTTLAVKLKQKIKRI